jgi:hypothetical protein
MWTKVTQMILSSELFQSQLAKYGEGRHLQRVLNLKSMADELESETESETTSNSLTTAPSHEKPLISVLTWNKKFIPHYFTLYVLALHIRCAEKSTSLLHMYICNLLSLMQIKSDNASDNNDDCTSPPVLYVVLLFLDAFDDAFFNDSFKWQMKHNPDFGNGAYGFLSPYCVEHSGFILKW